MSFDIFLQRFADGKSVQVERQPVRQVLRSVEHRGPDDFGFYLVAFPDGVEAEFSAEDLESGEPFMGCAFHIRAFSDDLMKFILDVARAGDMVIIPAMEGNPLLLVSEVQKKGVPADVRESLRPIVVESSGELGAVLLGGFEGWLSYRDRVFRQPQSN